MTAASAAAKPAPAPAPAPTSQPATAASAAPPATPQPAPTSKTEATAHPADTNVGRWRRSLYLLLACILFSGCHWGFVSFSAATLHDTEGLSYTQIGSFLPVFAISMVVASFVVGVVSERFTPKRLLQAGVAINTGGVGLVAFSDATFGVMLAGFALIGVGYSPLRLVPYVQIRQYTAGDTAAYNRWFLALTLAFVFSFSAGRGLMMLTTSYIDNDGFSWALPWYIAGAWQGLFLVLITLYGHFPAGTQDLHSSPPPAPSDGAASALPSWDVYLRKVRSLYCNPVSGAILAAYLLLVYPYASVAIWTPTIALARFPSKSEAEVNVTTAVAFLISMPLGLGVTQLILTRIRTLGIAARFMCGATVVAVGAMVAYVVLDAAAVFEVWVAAAVVFIGAVSVPHLFVNILPGLLRFDPALQTFALSRFVLFYTVGGDICGNFVTGLILDETSVDTTVVVLLVSISASAVLSFVPAVWSCQADSPVTDIATAAAQRRWGQLRKQTVARITASRAAGMLVFRPPPVRHFLSVLLGNGSPAAKAPYGAAPAPAPAPPAASKAPEGSAQAV